MRLLPLLLLLLATPLPAGELDGHYRGTLDQRVSELILRSQGQQVEGEYLEGSRRFRLTGRVDGQALQGQISDPESGQVLANLNANYANGMLNAAFAARDPASGEAILREALFERLAPPPDPDHDPTLIGTWVHERLDDGDGAAPRTVTTLRIRADGSIAQWTCLVAGGSEWSYDRPGELQYSGGWRSERGLLLVRLKGAEDFQPAAHYRFDPPYLVTRSNTGEMRWQRR
ncbi:MAG: hypothetical protein LPK18_14265 [Pseudomonadaceae bacterium]|nr:hypothetical protein [Pseudomonadaceae bacterium]